VRRLLPAAIAVALALLAGCEKLDRNMYDNPAFRPQEEPVRMAPADSVPTKGRGTVPLPGSPAAAAMKNPEKVTDFSLLTGKELYGIHCTPCHGESGKGDGPVAEMFVPTPVDISPSGHGAHHPTATCSPSSPTGRTACRPSAATSRRASAGSSSRTSAP